MTILYPSSLPIPARGGYKGQTTNPLLRTTMRSGRAKQRRRFSNVPQMWDVSWTFSRSQALAFESWYRDALLDGAEWFVATLKTPLGTQEYTCRFTGIYSGPTLFGLDKWQYSAELELSERPLVPIGQGLFPDYIAGSELFDTIINVELPL